MGHTSITLGLLFGLSAAVSQLPDGLFQTREAQAASSRTATARAGEAGTLQDVTAAALVEALRSRFAGSDVEFRFDSFASRRLSERDLQVTGGGQFRLEGGMTWLPIRYAASYDTATATIDSPQITLRTQQLPRGQAAIDADALGALVGERLTQEFESQSVQFDLDELTPVAGDARYVAVDGSGVARFAGEGTAMVSVQAVLDRTTGQWLGVSYDLGGEADAV